MSRAGAIVPADEAGSFMTRTMRALGLAQRPPIRLLAVPRDPVAGDKAAGMAVMQDRLTLGGLESDLIAISKGELWERLHGFAWLRDLAAATGPERGRSITEAIARRWLDKLPDRVEAPEWRPDLWGRRLLFWPAYAPFLLASRDADYRGKLLRLMVRGAQHIERSGDKGRAGLPRIAAWSGAVAASLLIQSLTDRIDKCEAGLERALRSGMSDDGGLLSRDPAEQLELIELLPLLRAAYATTTRGMPDWLEEAQQGALSALLCVVAPDGALGSWQGGNPGDPRRLHAAVTAATMQDLPTAQARGWGYQRLQVKDALVVMDAAPPPAAKDRDGACASTLAFEFSEGDHRLVVNCGGAGDVPSRLSAELRHLLRSTAAHSTLVLGDTNSTAILDNGGLGRGVEEVTMERGIRDGFHQVEASHDGYVRRFGLVHQRQLLVAPDGRTVQGNDSLVAKGKTGKAAVPFVLRFHLAPGVEVTSTADGRGALLRTRGKATWQFKVRGGLAEVEDSLWIDGQAGPRPSLQIAVTGESPPDGMTVSWELKRAG